jgi:CBS domain-containing protein
MKLQQIMVADVIQISPEEPVSVAAKRMREKSVGCLVVTIDGLLKGIITDRDLLGCIAEGHRPSACPVLKHLSRPVVVLKPEEDVSMAAKVMREKRIKRLPIATKGKLVGIISLSDLAAVGKTDAEQVSSSFEFLSSLIEIHAAQGIVVPKAAPVRAGDEGTTGKNSVEKSPVQVQAA